MSGMRCAVCGLPVAKDGKRRAARGLTAGPYCWRTHTAQELADHFRTELIRRGYPDPWRKREEGAA